ncbi:hypothetical protein T439DRAFT_331858 [Meredithblackwellia eburnea MCA 4105]
MAQQLVCSLRKFQVSTTLFNLALVSKSWNKTFQPILWEFIYIKTAESLIKLLESEGLNKNYNTSSLALWGDGETTFEAEHVVQLLKQLPHIQSLALSGVARLSGDTFSLSSLEGLQSLTLRTKLCPPNPISFPFRNLTRLVLETMDYGTLDLLDTLAHSAKSAQTLRTLDASRLQCPDGIATIFAFTPYLTSLHLCPLDTPDVYAAALAGLKKADKLRFLSLRFRAEDDPAMRDDCNPSLSHLLDGLPATLEVLRLEQWFPDVFEIVDLRKALKLPCLATLRKLEFGLTDRSSLLETEGGPHLLEDCGKKKVDVEFEVLLRIFRTGC